MTAHRPLARMNRNTLIAAGVVVFHVLALWALQTGLIRQAAEILIPAEVLTEFIEPPAPSKPVPPAPPPLPKPAPPKASTPASKAPAPAPAAPAPTLPQAPVDNTAPNPHAVTASAAASPAAAVAANPAPSTTQPLAAPAPAKVEQPSSDADYLQNPKPAYPALSKRLGEQGKVVVRVLIGADGTPQKAEIRQSSGFDRLDQAALSTVMRWRYVPGKRAGVPEAMWYQVPINFVLE